ncbi:hypothetical protein SAMN04487894_104173 [Niabella drilacis]|uniref:Uncharacterized protein n=1 Tax=Niabella drilacis (strain DSM 25811 / CCM 8410 / CCUG 62505 / LMG 26954 / E90) TaxID=1285928 RepID=A0A1G6PWB4_NIADE|nr:hypothetical protein SAMN04487894_104173 [Niabella drilacis]
MMRGFGSGVGYRLNLIVPAVVLMAAVWSLSRKKRDHSLQRLNTGRLVAVWGRGDRGDKRQLPAF